MKLRHCLSATVASFVLAAIAACSDTGSSPTADGGSSGSGADSAGATEAGAGAGDGAIQEAATQDVVSDATTSADGAVACNGVSRPQLTDSEAAQDTILGYLAQAGSFTAPGGLVTDHWDPTAGVGDVSTFTPTYTVAASGDGGAYTTVQAAVTAAVAAGGTSRVYILVTPGTYREVVCIGSGAPPITLYSTNADASQTVIVYNNFNGESSDAGTPNPCSPPGATTYGTNGSATFAAFANGFEAKNITFSNDVTSAELGMSSGTQAVALYTQADQVVLDNVRVLGHQDSLYIETPSSNSVVRAYVKNSFVAGDVDFIFGGATFVLDGCQIQFVSDRRAPTTALAPSTDSRNNFGILVINSQFTADAKTAAGSADLGRAWDRSCTDVPTYVATCVGGTAGHYPNGQAVVRQSSLDNHIAAAPWVASATTKRPFCSESWSCLTDGATCPANRLFEYQNTGPGDN